MKKIFFITLLSCCAQLIYAQTTLDVIDDMLKTIDNIESSTFTLVMKERFGDKYVDTKSDIKVKHKPHSIYMKQYYPNNGIEILWSKGQNNNKALINPNGFPYINISLNPYHARMRKGNHHTIFTAGFKQPAVILRHAIQKMSDAGVTNFEEYLDLENVNHQGIDCYKLTLEQTDFAYENYTLKKDEYLRDIATRNQVSEHKLMELNDIRNYNKLKTGTSIRIPNFYAKTTIMYIDKNLMLPIVQQIYDEKGLYEAYEFSNVVINPRFSDNEFTEDYKTYGF